MRIGVISEGHSDRAVIANIIFGIAGIDSSDIEALRPLYLLDETDKALRPPETFSSWSVVKEECENRELIDGFLAIDGQDFVIIHLDSAESAQYGVNRTANKLELRDLIIRQINSWLKNQHSDSILYAIAIEETDAWILTIYEAKDSTTTIRAKERLSRVLGKNQVNSSPTFDNYLILSKPFRKSKNVKQGGYLSYNHSLEAFCKEIETKVLPKLSI